MSKQDWLDALEALAEHHDEILTDRAGWLECWEVGQSPTWAFYQEYPEHRPPRKPGAVKAVTRPLV